MAEALQVVLFDLDGTVLDTAPDMHRTLNELLRENHRAPQPYAAVRPSVSHGAGPVVKIGFPDVSERRCAELQRRYLEIYSASIAVETRLFPGMDAVLLELAARGLRAGIVTNKAGWLTEPLLQQLGLRERFVCVVSGDTVAERKPHPLPMLHAAALAGVPPSRCIYVGDAARDVEAAHAAGMAALVAAYGYVPSAAEARTWGGDGYLESPLDLLPWLETSGRL